jgi:hypothetical protein
MQRSLRCERVASHFKQLRWPGAHHPKQAHQTFAPGHRLYLLKAGVLSFPPVVVDNYAGQRLRGC